MCLNLEYDFYIFFMLIGSLHQKAFTFKPHEIKCNIGLNAIILKHVSKIKIHLFKIYLYYWNYNNFYLCLISHVSKKKNGSLVKGQCFEWKNFEFKYCPRYLSFFFNKKPGVHFIEEKNDCQKNYKYFYICNLCKRFEDRFNIVLSFTSN